MSLDPFFNKCLGHEHSLNILYHHRTQGRGVERVHIMGMVEAWQAIGHTVDLASPPGVSLENSMEKEGIEGSRSQWKRMARLLPEVGFEILELFYNVWAYISLSRRLKQVRYDFIYERYAFLCMAGILASRRRNVPFLLEVNYTSRTRIVRKRTLLVRNLECILESWLFKWADGIVVVSSYLRRELLRQGIEQGKIIVLPNAADPVKFHPEIEPEDLRKQLGLENKKVVGFVGYFYPWHGIELFVNTYTYVRKRVRNVSYLLVGDGPIHKRISETVKEGGCEEDIIFVGSVFHGDVPRYMALFDMAVMPNSNEYGSPMKALEYMSMAKAVVAPRLGPLEDIMDNGKEGLLFEPGNEHDLAESIVKVLSDCGLRHKMGASARQRVVTQHNWCKNAHRVLSLYQEVSFKPGFSGKGRR